MLVLTTGSPLESESILYTVVLTIFFSLWKCLYFCAHIIGGFLQYLYSHI